MAAIDFSLKGLDYIAICIYMVLMAGIGIFFGWFVKDAGAYLKGSGTIPWMVAGISNFMTLFSTFVFVAYAGIAYEHGLVSVTILWVTVPSCIFGAVFVAKRWRRTRLTSPIEYLEVRFNEPVRQITAWAGIVMRLLDNMVRLYALGIFLTVVTPLNLQETIIISGIIITFFTVLGGVWAVTVMGSVQFLILIFATLILVPLSLREVGGLAGLSEKIPQHLHWFNGPKGAPFWLSIYYLMIIIKTNENWAFIQRFYCVRDEKSAQKTMYMSAFLFLIFPIVFLLPAVTAKLIFPELPDKEMAYVAVSAKLLPPGLMGIMIISMFSATMSTLNAEYNAISSVLTTDIYKRIFRQKAGEKELLRVAQLFTIITGMLILFGGIYVKHFGGAFEANKLFTGIFAIPIGIPLIFGLLVRKSTPKGAAATIILGAIAGIILNLFPGTINWEVATLIEIIICFAIFIGSGYIKVNGKRQVIEMKQKAFFELVNKPVSENEKPTIDPKFKSALIKLFIVSFLICGALFIGMSILSFRMQSGILGISSGVICILLAFILWIVSRKYQH